MQQENIIIQNNVYATIDLKMLKINTDIIEARNKQFNYSFWTYQYLHVL